MTSRTRPQPTTVNVLAYNSSAVDPFTNTMVKSCTRDNVTVKHDPIDFAGQVQKTTATLAGDKGTYDIIETYSFIIGTNADADKLQPLDELFAKYSEKYKLDALDESMREGMSYEGKLYGLPMQAQMFVMAYRKDVFDKNGLSAPKTLRRDDRRGQEDPGRRRHEVPDRPALAGHRGHRHPVRRDPRTRWAPTSSIRRRRSRSSTRPRPSRRSR